MQPMGLLAWIVVTLIATWLASQVVARCFGITDDTAVGMAGALLSGLLLNQVGAPGSTGFSIWRVSVVVVGAVVLTDADDDLIYGGCAHGFSVAAGFERGAARACDDLARRGRTRSSVVIL